MTKDYTQMWKELGLDLDGHAGLLDALGGMYRDIYLSQRERPAGMAYWDFVLSEIHGLRVEELLEARRQGRKVIGTFCLYVPEELVLAGRDAELPLPEDVVEHRRDERPREEGCGEERDLSGRLGHRGRS